MHPNGVRVVKIENREAYEEARVAEVVRRRQTHLVKGANARARAAPATELVMTLITAAIIAYAGWRSQSGGMNVGAFMAFILALGLASQSLRQLSNLATVMAEGMSAARRLFAALDAILGLNHADADPQTPDDRIAFHRLITLIWFPLQFGMLAFLLWYVPRADLGTLEKVGIFFGQGVMSGTIGIVYAPRIMRVVRE